MLRKSILLFVVVCGNPLLGLVLGQNVTLGLDVARPMPGTAHDYIHGLSETVDPSTGNLSIKIDLPVPSSRGTTLPFAITYNSGEVHRFTSPRPGCAQFDVGPCPSSSGLYVDRAQAGHGWSDTLPYTAISSYVIPVYGSNGTLYEYCPVSSSYNFYDPSGGSHMLNLAALGAGSLTTSYNVQTRCTQLKSGNSFTYTSAQTGGDDQYQAKTEYNCDGNSYNVVYPADCTNATPSFTVKNLDGTTFYFPADTYQVGGTSGAGFAFIFPTRIEDRNGNNVQFTVPTNALASQLPMIDTAGRQAVSMSNPTGSPGSTSYTVGGLTYKVAYESVGASYTVGTHQVYPFPAGSYTCGFYNEVSDSSFSVVKSITLPNGQAYNFSYDPTYGLVNEIDYPDGGWVKYKWGISTDYRAYASFDGLVAGEPPYTNACDYEYQTPVVMQREVGFAGTSPALTQAFTYSTMWDANAPAMFDSKGTVVETTDNVTNLTAKTSYTYSPASVVTWGPDSSGFPGYLPVEASITSYDWGTSTSPIQTVQEKWFTTYDLASRTTTLNNGQTKGELYCYVNPLMNGLVIEKDEYNFGQTIPSPNVQSCSQSGAFRKTTYTYGGRSSPCQQITYNSAGTRMAESDAYYDGSSTVCGSGSGTTQSVSDLPAGSHDETGYGSSVGVFRGNVTKALEWSNTALPSPTQSSTYDETGQVLSAKDGNGNTTQYSYTDEYSSGGPASGTNTNTYLTHITKPAVNVSHTESFTYAYVTGQLTEATDENGQQTKYQYSDSLNRITSITRPADPNNGGMHPTTTYVYTDTIDAPNVATSTTINTSGTEETSVQTRDGMGHVVRTAITSDPSGADDVDNTYNGQGMVYTKTNPYRSGQSAGQGTTTFSYDALGRPTKQIQPDNSTLLWCYNGVSSSGETGCAANASSIASSSWVDYYDETGKHWQHVSDMAGRLIASMEPDATTNALSYETDYVYDVLDNLTGVDQYGGKKGSGITADRKRVFTYDSLSRLLSALNPEAGTICYGVSSGGNCIEKYDGNGNLIVKTDARGTQITYAYDALDRITSKHYSDNTPTAYYQYDSSEADPGQTDYAVGRLSAKWTSLNPNSTNINTDNQIISADIYQYDPFGRTVDYDTGAGVYGEVSNDTSYYGGAVAMTYDLMGNVRATTTYADQTSTQRVLDYAYDGANHLTKVSVDSASIGVNSSLPVTLFESTSYSAIGLTGAGMAYTNSQEAPAIMLTQAYDNRMRVNLGSYITGSGAMDGSGMTLYSYSMPSSGGYAANGNVTKVVDSVVGTDVLTYDSLSRLGSGQVTAGTFQGLDINWTYDQWGDRLSQSFSGTYSGPLPQSTSATYSTSNRVTFTQNATSGYTYDASGNVLNDGVNLYAYDAEGRVCAAYSSISNAYTAYQYDADGLRMSKATFTPTGTGVSATNCSPTQPQFTVLETYTYSPSGQMMQRFNSGVWENDNVFRGSTLMSSYSGKTSYYGDQLFILMPDWLGSTRAQITSDGNPSNLVDYAFLPYGDDLTKIGSGADPTGLHLTGKERDTESGLDYFGARYYSSNMGRWMSPDWADKPEAVPYSQLDNPQSLNLYGYVNNNPLSKADADGHDANDAYKLLGGLEVVAPEATPLILGAAAAVGVYQNRDAISQGVQSLATSITSFFSSGSKADPVAPAAPIGASVPATGQKSADFVVTPGGTAVATDPGRVNQSLQGAPGVTQSPSRDGTGTINTGVSTTSGNKVDVRTMPGNDSHGPRTVITATGTNRPATPDGTHTNDKNDSHIPNDAKHPGSQ